MVKAIKLVALGSILAASAIYGASTAACVGCHGKNFEKVALGKSKIVKNMSKADIIKALKGYKSGSYGGAMKSVMKSQVANLSDKDIENIADAIKGAPSKSNSSASAASTSTQKVIDINAKVADKARLNKEDLGNKKVVSEEMLGLRKTTLFDENVKPAESKYTNKAPGTAKRYERAYVNAPPMIPHSVDGLLPITKAKNACLGCHMPAVAKAVGATPIPPTHFMDYRPKTVFKNGVEVKDGKVVGLGKGDLGNTGDIKLVKPKKLDKLYPGRYNCSQCHVSQANVDVAVGNTFKPDGLNGDLKAKSHLIDMMDDGVK